MPGQGCRCEGCGFRAADLQLAAAGRLGPYIGTVQTEAPTFRILFHGSGACARAKNTSGETAVPLSVSQQLRYKTVQICVQLIRFVERKHLLQMQVVAF